MKRFDELNEREEKSKKQLEIRKIFSKRNICIALICIVVALALAFVWANLYETHQRKRIENWQQESAANQNNYTISWDWGNTKTETTSPADENKGSIYEDLKTEIIGIEKSSDEYLRLYLSIDNPNANTVDVISEGIYLNNVCVADFHMFDSVVGGKETLINVTVSYSEIIAKQIGSNISSFSMQYYFDDEYDVIRETSQDNLSYVVEGEEIVNTEKKEADDEINTIEEEAKEEKREIYGKIASEKYDNLKIKYTNSEIKDKYIVLDFLVENASVEDYDITFWYESVVNEYTLKMLTSSDLSGDFVPAQGSAILTIKYALDDLQYCGIEKVNMIQFLIGDAETSEDDAVEVSFENLKIDIPITEITKKSVNGRIKGILSEGEMSKNIDISYVGYGVTDSQVCLKFIAENNSKDYYGFTYWYASQVNRCAVDMSSSSEISGALDAKGKVLLSIKYNLEMLKKAQIEVIDEMSFLFDKKGEDKGKASTAKFTGLNIPII